MTIVILGRSKMKKNVYKIKIPGDLGTVEEIYEVAIAEARERARLYVMPATWEARIIEGEVGVSYEVTVQVTRYHN